MTRVSLDGTTLSAELHFFAGTIEVSEDFELTGEQAGATAAYFQHLLVWAAEIEKGVGDNAKPICFCMQGLIDFFRAAERAGRVTLNPEARHQLRSSAIALYHLAKEAEGLLPVEPRFIQWDVPMGRPANDAGQATAADGVAP